MNHLQKSVSAFFRQSSNLGIRSLSQTSFTANTENESVIESQTSDESPILYKRDFKFCPKYLTNRQVWVESLKDIKERKKGLVELHPKIFGTMPRLDLIFDNVKWQNLYQNVVVYSAKVKTEFRGHNRKPWPQKGTGRARQGSIRSPQFKNGGTCHGPRNPTSYFYMIPWELRVHGLTSTLSAKFAQDDIHVVDDLQIPTDDKQYILDLIKERNWGPSVLMVDVNDIMPRNITIATDDIGHVNLMPVYGLNVVGMLKHDTLILTLAAVKEIEKNLVTLLNTANPLEMKQKFSFLG